MTEASELLDKLNDKADEINSTVDHIDDNIGKITDELTRIKQILEFCGQALLNIEKRLDVLKPANLEQIMKSFGFEAKK